VSAKKLRSVDFRSRQSWERNSDYLVSSAGDTDHHVRIEIKRDSYDFQSYGTAEIFDTMAAEWHPAVSIPYPLVAVTRVAPVEGHERSVAIVGVGQALTDAAKALFAEDEASLLDRVCELLRTVP
jgi:hypothetical protein